MVKKIFNQQVIKDKKKMPEKTGPSPTEIRDREIEKILDALEAVRNCNGPESQRQLLELMKANPQLMEKFFRQRQVNFYFNILQWSKFISNFLGSHSAKWRQR